jgi:regulator of protease activity HflC (stomatin/prohibitin superfamily)
MMITFSILLLLAAAAPPPSPNAPPPSVAAFAGLFTPWSAAERDSRAAEEQARTAEAPPPADAERRRIEAVARGERVGEVVRSGDCEEGERIARAAGDFALVRAVRDHCRSAPAR